MKAFKSPLILGLLLLLQPLASVAEEISYGDLLALPMRPTMALIRENLANIPDDVGIPEDIRREPNAPQPGFAHWLRMIELHGPRLIAAAEFSFPRATWAFVGRDTSSWADLFEAFYLTRGQSNRVVRIGMSKATLASAEVARGTNVYDRAKLYQFLQGYGFDLTNILSKDPFILVDTISSGYGRQGRNLIDAVYSTYRDMGGAVADLVRKFNLFGLVVSTFPVTGKELSFENASTHLFGIEEFYRLNPTANVFTHHSIITYRDRHHDRNVAANEAGYVHFVDAWHDSFGALYTDPVDGKLKSHVGARNDLTSRRNVLWLQREIWKVVNNPSFLANVRLEAQRIGYDFDSCAGLLGGQP